MSDGSQEERDYDAFIDAVSKDCRCCDTCVGVCDGVQAGGICDDMCMCGERNGYDGHDLDDEDDDGAWRDGQ